MKPDEIERQFSAGECIIELGSKLRVLYVIQTGQVQLRGPSGGDECSLGPSAIFGELTAIAGTPSPYRAVAQEDTRVLLIELPLLNRLCLQNPDFTFRLIRHLASSSSPSLPLAVSAGTGAAGGSAGGALEALAGVILKRSTGSDSPSTVEGKLRDLAQDTGLSMLTTYAALHSLLDKRWLRLIDDELTLLQREELEALARSTS